MILTWCVGSALFGVNVGDILQVMSALTMNNVMQFPFDILKRGWGEGTLLVLFIYLMQSDIALVLIHPGSASP